MVRFVVSHSKLASFFFFFFLILILERVWFETAVSRLPYIRVITAASQVLPLCKVGGGGGYRWGTLHSVLSSSKTQQHTPKNAPNRQASMFKAFFLTTCIMGGAGTFSKIRKSPWSSATLQWFTTTWLEKTLTNAWTVAVLQSPKPSKEKYCTKPMKHRQWV